MASSLTLSLSDHHLQLVSEGEMTSRLASLHCRLHVSDENLVLSRLLYLAHRFEESHSVGPGSVEAKYN